MDLLLLPALALVVVLGLVLFARRRPRVPTDRHAPDTPFERDRRGRDVGPA